MARLLLGVTGGIAAYKMLETARLAIKAGHSVRVIQTEAGQRFVGAASFAALSGAPVLSGEFEEDPARGAFPGQQQPPHRPLSHLQLVANADLYLIAPASANTLAKLAAGLADNLPCSCALAATCPVAVAPAMNNHMYEHPATQANLALLRERGVHVIDPGSGRLASIGEHGVGRLAEPQQLLCECERLLGGEGAAPAMGARQLATGLRGLRVLVSAGGTREPIDGVRFLGNRSSGRMGVALAEEARRRGAEVILLATNLQVDPPYGVETIPTPTAESMLDAALALPDVDIALLAAAVADYRPAETLSAKRPKDEHAWTVELAPTGDVAKALGAQKRAGQVLVVFGAEHGEEGLDRKRAMLQTKNADLVVYNDVARSDIGFDSHDNEVVLVTRDRERAVAKTAKRAVAAAVLDAVEELLAP